jgi:hypothetical protein
VPNSWVNETLELFYLIHKGREFKHEEVLTAKEHVWIGEILNRCESANYTIDLIPDPSRKPPELSENGIPVCKDATEQVRPYHST